MVYSFFSYIFIFIFFILISYIFPSKLQMQRPITCCQNAFVFVLFRLSHPKNGYQGEMATMILTSLSLHLYVRWSLDARASISNTIFRRNQLPSRNLNAWRRVFGRFPTSSTGNRFESLEEFRPCKSVNKIGRVAYNWDHTGVDLLISVTRRQSIATMRSWRGNTGRTSRSTLRFTELISTDPSTMMIKIFGTSTVLVSYSCFTYACCLVPRWRDDIHLLF